MFFNKPSRFGDFILFIIVIIGIAGIIAVPWLISWTALELKVIK